MSNPITQPRTLGALYRKEKNAKLAQRIHGVYLASKGSNLSGDHGHHSSCPSYDSAVGT